MSEAALIDVAEDLAMVLHTARGGLGILRYGAKGSEAREAPGSAVADVLESAFPCPFPARGRRAPRTLALVLFRRRAYVSG